jgi:t-SNARE complex subunit (syntaxin)
MPDETSEYARGVAAGAVLARLNAHDQHFDKINGSMERVAQSLHDLVAVDQQMLMAIQRQDDRAVADRATVITTATALEKAEQARRDKSTSGWTPFQRVIAVVTVLAAVAGVIAYFVTASHG